MEKEHTVSFPKRKETAKTETSQKNVFFQMTGKYVKGEEKEGTEKRINQIKENHQKKERYIQEREQKMRMSKKQTRKNTKKKKKKKKKKLSFLVKGMEREETCKNKATNLLKCPTKKGKKICETCRSVRKSFSNEG